MDLNQSLLGSKPADKDPAPPSKAERRQAARNNLTRRYVEHELQRGNLRVALRIVLGAAEESARNHPLARELESLPSDLNARRIQAISRAEAARVRAAWQSMLEDVGRILSQCIGNPSEGDPRHD